ncbi:MAG TPA: DUF2852 domain-containing protein [Alphaproteobacteria bacterium]|nr:DUF2852 domain-containing protein [Alphaproteobacteria bacterium]
MSFAARLDDIGKPAWIGLIVLSFVIFWPLGLALLAYVMWSGRMGCWKHAGAGRWHEGMRSAPGRWYRMQHSSGNSAFDEYREETLRRLEEEQREFKEFLDRLRQAKDKAEFDQFMAERSRPSQPSEPSA